MKALIMAGGKGTRLQIDEEKPLITLNGSTLIDRMLSIAKGTLGLGEIYVAVSGNTPKTERYLSAKNGQGFRLVRTKGKSYHEDLREAITNEMLFEPVVVLPVDMPFIRPEFLDYAIERYIACERMALSVFIRVDGSWIPRSGPFELDGNMVVPSGISIINGECISWAEMSQLDIIVDHERQFLNINSLEDLIMAGEE